MEIPFGGRRPSWPWAARPYDYVSLRSAVATAWAHHLRVAGSKPTATESLFTEEHQTKKGKGMITKTVQYILFKCLSVCK